MTDLRFPYAFNGLFRPARNKVYYGGRAAGRSWNFARALLIRSSAQKLKVGCFREFQTSIKDSVHAVLTSQIDKMGMNYRFHITERSIRSDLGGEFIFKGFHRNVDEIKSVEDLDVAWCEEAQSMSKRSLQVLVPTVRKEGSELWFSLNTGRVEDPIYQELIINPRPDSIVKKVTYRHNPYLPREAELERLHMLERDEEAYAHVWEGGPLRISAACIFARRVVVEAFDTPENVIFYHGADWGFSNDPNVLIRCFIIDEELYIDQEVFGYGVEIDDTPALFDMIDSSRKWPILADCARPETISYMRRKGFNITGAEKWDGSIEDGIAHLKGFKKIHIHQRCKHMAKEAELYSYKVDRVTEEVLPIVVDAHNHGWDSVRYALSKFIKQRGGLGIWAKLGGAA